MTEFKKFKLFINPLEEEKWINEQLSKGYKLINLSHLSVYTFISTDEDYIVRIDYRTISNRGKYHEYIDLHEQFGWSHVFGYRHGAGNQYWQKIEDNNDELFSDTETKTAYYKRIQNLIISLIVMFAVYLLTLDNTQLENIFNNPFTLTNNIGYIFLATLLFIYALTYIKIKYINTKNGTEILGGRNVMIKNLLTSLIKILGFVIVAFVIIRLFDQFNIASNGSGILNSFSKFGWINLYQDPIFNGLFTLIIILSVVMIIVTLVKELSPKR